MVEALKGIVGIGEEDLRGPRRKEDVPQLGHYLIAIEDADLRPKGRALISKGSFKPDLPAWKDWVWGKVKILHHQPADLLRFHRPSLGCPVKTKLPLQIDRPSRSIEVHLNGETWLQP